MFHHELGILWFLVCLSTSLIRFDGRVPWLLLLLVGEKSWWGVHHDDSEQLLSLDRNYLLKMCELGFVVCFFLNLQVTEKEVTVITSF